MLADRVSVGDMRDVHAHRARERVRQAVARVDLHELVAAVPCIALELAAEDTGQP